MKQIRCLGILLIAGLTLFTSTSFGEKLRKFEIKNRDTPDVYCAYAYVDATQRVITGLEYHIEGWVRVPSGHAVTIRYASKYPDLSICIRLADGALWRPEDTVKDTVTAEFNVPVALREDSFKVIYGITDGTIDNTHRYTSVDEEGLETQTFYDMFPQEMGKTVSITIQGIKNIIEDEEYIPPPQPGDTSEPAAEFDGVYDTRGLTRQGKDYALLFATNTYQHWRALTTPIKDAEELGSELEKYGFEVDIRKEVQTRADILNAITEYADKPYPPDSQLFVYFAGHGHFSEKLKDGYIAASDSKLPADDPPHTTYVAYARLKQDLDMIKCGRVMLVLDVCYGGTFDRKYAIAPNVEPPTRGPSREPPQLDIADTLKRKTRWYLSSGQKEEVQDGGGLRHSPFAASLLTLLRNGAGTDRVLTIPEIEHQLPSTLEAELDKIEVAWREKHPLWEGKIQQTPASGPFGTAKKSDKAFVFIRANE